MEVSKARRVLFEGGVTLKIDRRVERERVERERVECVVHTDGHAAATFRTRSSPERIDESPSERPPQVELGRGFGLRVQTAVHPSTDRGAPGVDQRLDFELNVYKPVMIHNVLESIRLLADGADSFRENCVRGLDVDRERIDTLMKQSLMLVTVLNRHIGYDNAAKVAKKAYEEGTTLVEAVTALGLMTEDEFQRAVVPSEMTAPR
ncbi:MAG: hypothetical protein AAF690_22090 [Acidobacteriota bacterium]